MSLWIPGLSRLVPIGRDALGLMFEARRDADGARVSLRVINKPLTDRQRELLASLSAKFPVLPNLLAVNSTGTTEDGSVYLVAEPRSNESGALETTAPLTFAAASELVRQIVPTLTALHDRGLVHGAISPAAVLHLGDRWVLADAGIAEIIVPLPPLADLPMDELLFYLAPEVLFGKPCSPAADIYSLAATVGALRDSHPLYAGVPGESVLAYGRRGQVVPQVRYLEEATDLRPERRWLPGMPRPSSHLAAAADTTTPAAAPVPELPQRLQGRGDRPIAVGSRASSVDVTSVHSALDLHTNNVVDHDVQFSVYRPKIVNITAWETMLVVAHKSQAFVNDEGETVDPIAEVARRARRRLGNLANQQTSIADSIHQLPRGSLLHIVPDVEGLIFNPPQASFLWAEPIHEEEFRFRPTDRMAGHHARGRVSIFCGMLLIADVSISIKVADQDQFPAPAIDGSRQDIESDSARRYRTIFASYSHLDAEVVDWFEQIHRTLGDQLMRDIRHLRSGEIWAERLESMIRESDLFQLFWSSNARTSEFVRKEWTYALGLERDRFVRPVYWETPMPLAPDELSRVHFTYFGMTSAAATKTTGDLLVLGSRGETDKASTAVAVPPSPSAPDQAIPANPVAAAQAQPQMPTIRPGRRLERPAVPSMAYGQQDQTRITGSWRVSLPRTERGATIALVLSVIGMFGGVMVLNAIAIWLAVHALRQIRAWNGVLPGSARAWAALYLGIVGLTGWAAILALAAFR